MKRTLTQPASAAQRRQAHLTRIGTDSLEKTIGELNIERSAAMSYMQVGNQAIVEAFAGVILEKEKAQLLHAQGSRLKWAVRNEVLDMRESLCNEECDTKEFALRVGNAVKALLLELSIQGVQE